MTPPAVGALVLVSVFQRMPRLLDKVRKRSAKDLAVALGWLVALPTLPLVPRMRPAL